MALYETRRPATLHHTGYVSYRPPLRFRKANQVVSFTLLPFVLVIAGYAGVQMVRDLRRTSYPMLAWGLAVLALMGAVIWMIFTAHPNY